MTTNLSFCTLTFKNNYVLSVINEGVVYSHEESFKERLAILRHFNDKSFIYISNRINSYSVDPLIYKEWSDFDNLIGFAVVSKNYLTISNMDIEKLFLDKPLKSFQTIKEAELWSKKILNKEVA